MDLKHFIFDFQKDPNLLQFSQTLHVLQDQKHRLGQSADHSQQSGRLLQRLHVELIGEEILKQYFYLTYFL